jgi:prepilin-type processing-associated H-X9-DG protein
LRQYIQDNDGLCPPGTTIESWKVALFPFLGTDKLFICPIAEADKVSYALNTKLAGANLDKLKNPDFIPVAFENRARHSGYRYVIFADGHVKSFTDSVWKSKILPRISTFVPDKGSSKK